MSLVLLGLLNARSATVTWDGDGGNFSWQTAANWSGNTPPGPNDDAIINLAGAATVTSSANVTIRSLQCSNNLALADGTFRVGGGSSVVQGAFTSTGFPTLSATGALTEFKVAGPVSVDGASFEALTGAEIMLPSFTSYTRGFSCFNGLWEASGGGVLDFPNLTNFFGGNCAGVFVNALNGGRVSLTNLAIINDGAAVFLADGGASLIDLPALRESLGAFRLVSLEARNGGTVWVPTLKRGNTLAVTVNPGATMPVAQLERLTGITVNGGNVAFPALTNFNEGTFSVNNGAVVSAPNLTTYLQGSSCSADSWTVSGADSKLLLPALTNLTGGSCAGLDVRALDGGLVLLTNVQIIADGVATFLADGTNSLIDLRALQQSPATFRRVGFDARNHGTVWVPLLVGGATVEVALRGNGVLPVAQLRSLAEISANGMTLSFPALTNFDSGSVTVENGAVVSAPNLTSYTRGSSCAGDFWAVNGAGSVLDLPGLASLNGGSCASLAVSAVNGGLVRLTNLTTIADGQLGFLANGADSEIDLPALQQSQATFRLVDFEIRNGGDITLPLFPGGAAVRVVLSGGGSMPVAQMRVLESIIVGGRTESFPALTNFDNGSFVVTNGAVVSAPSVLAYDRGSSCAPAPWTVNGLNSLLDLPGILSLKGGTCNPTTVQAANGGKVMLTNLTFMVEGALSFLADGTNSLVDLRALQQSQATLRTIALEARNGGTVHAPFFPGGSTVKVTLASGGVLPVAQMGSLNGITVNGMNVTFPGLTNFDTGEFVISNAAMVTIPNLTDYLGGGLCNEGRWLVSGAGSAVNLPALRFFTGKNCGELVVMASAGGDLLLGGVTNIPSGNVAVISDGAGSLVDLHSLNTFLNAAGLSSLKATNSGVILLNEQPWFLSGVTVGFSGTLLTNRNQLVLAADAWRSYWVEARNTASPTNEWIFYRRVPLTNDLQAIGPRAAANTEYRAWEFVADPYLLDLNRVGTNLQLVLFAPTNRTLDLQSASNLTPVINWETIATATMTNTFRIFPPEPATAPQRYFRARTL